MSQSTELTDKYEKEIMEVLKPLFKDNTTKEDISFYGNMVAIRLVQLKMETSEMLAEMYSKQNKAWRTK